MRRHDGRRAQFRRKRTATSTAEPRVLCDRRPTVSSALPRRGHDNLYDLHVTILGIRAERRLSVDERLKPIEADPTKHALAGAKRVADGHGAGTLTLRADTAANGCW
jgi:hypothetical protein